MVSSEDNKRCIFWLAVLSVFLTLPLDTHEFNFGFGDADETTAQSAESSAVEAKKLAATRRSTERKFKFHKIERVYVDDFIEEDDDDNLSADKDMSIGKENVADDDNDNDNDDDDDDDDDVDDDDEEEEEELETPARASTRKQTEKKTRKERKKKRNNSDDNEASILDWLFSTLWSFGGQPDNAKSSGNNIINWLQSFSEKLSTAAKSQEPEQTPVEENNESWLQYLNRWPFNSLFPSATQTKSSKKERITQHGRRHGAMEQDDDAASTEHQQPMSQEYFELLMHSLPSFVLNATHVDNGECRLQLQVLHRQMRVHKLWTLQMLDATGKITSGLLRGNIHQIGDFEQCTQTRAVVRVTPDNPTRIRGKYCLAHIEMHTRSAGLKMPVHLAQGRGLWYGHLSNPRHFMPRYTIANWGVCVPHACPASVVHDMLETNLRPYNKTGVEFHIDVSDEDCAMQQRKNWTKRLKKEHNLGISVLIIAVLVLTCLLALLWEQWSWISAHVQRVCDNKYLKLLRRSETQKVLEEKTAEHEEQSATEASEATKPAEAINENLKSMQQILWQLLLEVFGVFSPKRTLQALTSLERADLEFPLFHLAKLCATCMLYCCLKLLMLGHLPLTNRDSLVEAMDNKWSVLLRTPIIYSDVLLLLSGFMAAYQLSQEMQEKSHINLLKNVATKATRYLPTVYVVLLFLCWILPELGTGPLWNMLVGENARICKQQMWRSVFSMENTIEFDEACSPLTLQLALDVQLYLLAPLIVWLYHTDPEAGFFVYGALHAVSVALRYSRTQQEHLAAALFHGIHISKFNRTANLIYISPLSRATIYLLGLGAGLLYRSENGLFGIAPHLVPFGWALSILSIAWCFWSPAHSMHTDFVYTSDGAAAYVAWSPLILGLALCWFIFMFPLDASVFQRFPQLARMVLVLSRISFPLQLASFVMVLWNTASVMEPQKFHIGQLIDLYEIVWIVGFAIALAFIIDVPAQHVRRTLIERIFVSRESTETDPNDSAGTDKLTETETEPSIWESDPEEAEKSYIERRRSSVPDIGEKTEATKTDSKEDCEDEEDEEEEVEEE